MDHQEHEDQEHEVYGGEIPEMDADIEMSSRLEDEDYEHDNNEQDPTANSKELEDMKKRLKEIEDEAGALREMQAKVEKEMGAVQESSSTSATQAEKEEVDARSIYVGNVDYACTPEEVQQHFQSCGTVNRVTILTDKFGQPKGFAYVEFVEVEAVQNAVLLNESDLHGRQLKVSAKRTNVPGMKQLRGRGRAAPFFRSRGRGFMAPAPYAAYGYGRFPKGSKVQAANEIQAILNGWICTGSGTNYEDISEVFTSQHYLIISAGNDLLSGHYEPSAADPRYTLVSNSTTLSFSEDTTPLLKIPKLPERSISDQSMAFSSAATTKGSDNSNSTSSPKTMVYKDPDDGRQRFLLELEFIQCLANPTYIHYLAQNRYFEDEAFIAYLKYLQYWQRPEYIKFIMYPHCLYFLQLLQDANFRTAMAHPGNKELAHRQQFFFWKNFRSNRMKHILPRPLPEPPAPAPAPTNSHLPVASVPNKIPATTVPMAAASSPALSPMQYGLPSGSSAMPRNDSRTGGIDRRKRKKEL
ncbi:hypothetical protein ACFE04_027724 [Oxalis oulophora]